MGRSVLGEWRVIWQGTRDFVDRFIEKEPSGTEHSNTGLLP
jgi:hypothetical protein